MSRSIWAVILGRKGVWTDVSEVAGISEILANMDSLIYGCD